MSRMWSVCLLTAAILASLPSPRAAGFARSPVPAGDDRSRPSAVADVAVTPIRVLVDPRIELVSIVCRLAGYPEYRMGRIASYTADVDASFDRFKDHPVVTRARQLRKTRGISFNAPISLAVHLSNPPALTERVPFDPLPPGVDGRWTPSEARAFVADLRSFVREADVMRFLGRHEALYRTSTQRLETMAGQGKIVNWLEGFFGRRPDRRFVLVAGLLNGGGNYGALARGVAPASETSRADGAKAEEIFSVVGTESVDEGDLPAYPPRVAATIVHEFCHSYVNPLVDAHDAELTPLAEQLFALVEEQMRNQAYGVPKTVMYESLVRASTVRYLAAQAGTDAAAREAARDRELGFVWVGKLAETLLDYEQNRGKYATLEAFVPRVVAFFQAYGRTAAQDLQAAEAEQRAQREALSAKGPKVASMSPADGATDVDAAAVTVITITFDRPMREGNFALMAVPRTALPTFSGPPRFDATGRVLTLACTLKPDTRYGLQFNSPQHMAFVDTDGNPLAPLVYTFTTKK